MTDIVGQLIGGIVLVIIALVSFALFGALVSNPTLRTPQGLFIIKSATDVIVLLVVVGLPGGLLIVGLLRGLGGG